MSCWRIIIAIRLVVLSVILSAHASFAQAAPARHPQRIVSLAPSVTETLFALGFGNRLAESPPLTLARYGLGTFQGMLSPA